MTSLGGADPEDGGDSRDCQVPVVDFCKSVHSWASLLSPWYTPLLFMTKINMSISYRAMVSTSMALNPNAESPSSAMIFLRPAGPDLAAAAWLL